MNEWMFIEVNGWINPTLFLASLGHSKCFVCLVFCFELWKMPSISISSTKNKNRKHKKKNFFSINKVPACHSCSLFTWFLVQLHGILIKLQNDDGIQTLRLMQHHHWLANCTIFNQIEKFFHFFFLFFFVFAQSHFDYFYFYLLLRKEDLIDGWMPAC